jgi:hypothetical protein
VQLAPRQFEIDFSRGSLSFGWKFGRVAHQATESHTGGELPEERKKELPKVSIDKAITWNLRLVALTVERISIEVIQCDWNLMSTEE